MSSKYINKINALLAKAASTEFEAERDECLRLADRLMMEHAIDRAAVDPTNAVKAEGIVKTTWSLDLPYEFYTQIRQVFGAVIYHCNLRGVWTGWGKVDVIGYESDISFAEMLWPIVYREMSGNLWPKWGSERTFEQNVYAFVKGGYKWRAIQEEANRHDCEVPWPDGGRLKRAYHKECKARGEEPTAHTQRHSAFRASYATAFQSEISSRLREMRQRSAETVEEADRFALAVRDTQAKVDEEFYRLYPEYHPDYMREQSAAAQAAERERRAAMTEKQRQEEDERLRRRYERDRRHYERVRNREYDVNGWQHGTRVARNVDLSMGKGHITPNRKGVEA